MERPASEVDGLSREDFKQKTARDVLAASAGYWTLALPSNNTVIMVLHLYDSVEDFRDKEINMSVHCPRASALSNILAL